MAIPLSFTQISTQIRRFFLFIGNKNIRTQNQSRSRLTEVRKCDLDVNMGKVLTHTLNGNGINDRSFSCTRVPVTNDSRPK